MVLDYSSAINNVTRRSPQRTLWARLSRPQSALNPPRSADTAADHSMPEVTETFAQSLLIRSKWFCKMGRFPHLTKLSVPKRNEEEKRSPKSASTFTCVVDFFNNQQIVHRNVYTCFADLVVRGKLLEHLRHGVGAKPFTQLFAFAFTHQRNKMDAVARSFVVQKACKYGIICLVSLSTFQPSPFASKSLKQKCLRHHHLPAPE